MTIDSNIVSLDNNKDLPIAKARILMTIDVYIILRKMVNRLVSYKLDKEYAKFTG